MIEEIVKNLKSSPIFNLSLSSKELFHSNFISWLIVEYPIEMWSILSKYTTLKKDNFKIVKDSVKREENHIDIMFEITNETEISTVIIENKVKSLPYIKQLNEYSKKFPNAHAILLTLSTPNHLVNNQNKIIGAELWTLLTYNEFIFNLKNTILKTIQNGYHLSLIKDYIDFVENLILIEKFTQIENTEQFDWYDSNFEKLHEIRIADFYIKKKCENMALLILKEIKQIEGYDEKKIEVNSSIVHSINGEFRIYYFVNERVEISIEVSKWYYRKLVHVKNERKIGKIIIKYKTQYNIDADVVPFFKELDWFNFNHITTSDKYNSKKSINSFGSAKYLQCRLSSKNTIENIINYFKQDLEFIITKSEVINQKFKI